MAQFTNTIDFVKRAGIIVLLFAIAMSYHPTIVHLSRAAGFESGTILSRYIVVLFCFIFALSFYQNTVLRSTLLKHCLVFLLLIIVTSFVVFAFLDNNLMLHSLRSMLISLAAFCVGWELNLTRKSLLVIVIFFCSCVLFSGISQVMTNIGGFQIVDQYLADSKNALGAMLATVVLSLVFFSHLVTTKLIKYLMLAFALVSFIVIVTIRARAALITVVLLAALFVALRQKNIAEMIVTAFSAAVIALFLYLFLPSLFSFVDYSLHAGSQGEDFSSGRMDTYRDALAFLSQHPLLGNVNLNGDVGWVHNYPLLQLYQFGVLFSWPILLLYAYLFVMAFRRAWHNSKYLFLCACFIVALTPFIVSLVEPTFPFGPGTATVYNFILFGIAEKELYRTKKYSVRYERY